MKRPDGEDDRMGYKCVRESIVMTGDLNDLNLKKYTRRNLKDMEFAVKEGPMIEDILLKNGNTTYRVEISLRIFAQKEDE